MTSRDGDMARHHWREGAKDNERYRATPWWRLKTKLRLRANRDLHFHMATEAALRQIRSGQAPNPDAFHGGQG